MASGEPAYAVEDLTFAYDGAPVFEGLTVQLRAGRMVALSGPNGGGKSTLLRLLLGSLRPSSGVVRLFGRPLSRVPSMERARRVGYLPQEVSSVYAFTVAEVVLMGRHPRLPAFAIESRHDIGVAEQCMKRTEVLGLANRPFNTLSGGEKQRVLIASVLAQEPEVLLLDEPTAALDVPHQYSVMELLEGLHREGMTVLIVTHDLTVASRFCEEVWLLSGGRLVAQGAPREVVTEANLRAAYGAPIRVVPDPDTGLPLVLPPAEKVAHRCA